NIRPTPRFSGGTKRLGPATSCPSMSTRPALGRSTPEAILSSVVLPHPEGPTRQTISPGATSRLTLSSASLPSKSRDTPSKVNCAAKVTAALPRPRLGRRAFRVAAALFRNENTEAGLRCRVGSVQQPRNAVIRRNSALLRLHQAV